MDPTRALEGPGRKEALKRVPGRNLGNKGPLDREGVRSSRVSSVAKGDFFKHKCVAPSSEQRGNKTKLILEHAARCHGVDTALKVGRGLRPSPVGRAGPKAVGGIQNKKLDAVGTLPKGKPGDHKGRG